MKILRTYQRDNFVKFTSVGKNVNWVKKWLLSGSKRGCQMVKRIWSFCCKNLLKFNFNRSLFMKKYHFDLIRLYRKRQYTRGSLRMARSKIYSMGPKRIFNLFWVNWLSEWQTDRQSYKTLTSHTGESEIFFAFKFATSMLALLAGDNFCLAVLFLTWVQILVFDIRIPTEL
jgi:hypothetical protein